jgi:hypothetical protein
MPKTTEMTKAEFISRIKAKASNAKPSVKRVFFSGLARKNKAELRRLLGRIRVTRDGDIRVS